MADPHKDKSVASMGNPAALDMAGVEFGLAPALPLSLDGVDGYKTIKNYRQLAKQNLKMLVLTAPGERIMIPDFGVGLRNFLFEQNTATTHGEIEARIMIQVGKYLPYLEVHNVGFITTTDEYPEPYSSNLVHMTINYRIKPLDIYEVLDLSVARN